ncbi:hypothetical protein NITHO_5900002 [Nitrolancea hollandica Lb]|uniref:Uncharacterized protein n=1 Tax=Nitrolancea hollandica Lb TaxID=1129897 RepID=I4EMC5_9BACT|nr:hypothetical protein NITHO_5900002 [Nitrolancea hollandica Lb]
MLSLADILLRDFDSPWSSLVHVAPRTMPTSARAHLLLPAALVYGRRGLSFLWATALTVRVASYFHLLNPFIRAFTWGRNSKLNSRFRLSRGSKTTTIPGGPGSAFS